jgi:hypothetical protein
MAITLCVVRISDWATSGRLQGVRPIVEFLEVERTPVGAVTSWLRGQTGVDGALAVLTWVKGFELLILSLTLGCLIGTIVRDTQSAKAAADNAGNA